MRSNTTQDWNFPTCFWDLGAPVQKILITLGKLQPNWYLLLTIRYEVIHLQESHTSQNGRKALVMALKGDVFHVWIQAGWQAATQAGHLAAAQACRQAAVAAAAATPYSTPIGAGQHGRVHWNARALRPTPSSQMAHILFKYNINVPCLRNEVQSTLHVSSTGVLQPFWWV
jgi:hypothetical protein